MARNGPQSKGRKGKTAPRDAKRQISGAAGAASPTDLAVGPEERYQMIAEAAYYRAQQRGFSGGDPIQDWLEAEAEVAMRLGEATSQISVHVSAGGEQVDLRVAGSA